MDIRQKTTNLIDALKATCRTYGMGNDGNEYKIITQVFLYKFLNDKFGYEIKKLSKKIADSEKWEHSYQKMSEDERLDLFDKLSPDVPRLNPEHLISNLWNQQSKGDFDLIFDSTMIDIADKNIDIFSTQTSVNTKIPLFEKLTSFVTDDSARSNFARALVDRLVNFSFEEAFEKNYDFFATIFEYLIKDYNTAGGGKYAEYYTPHSIATIMANLLVGDQGDFHNVECYDPSAGTGTLLMALAHQVGEDKCTIYSQDISQRSNKMLKLNLILNNLVSSLDHAIQGDTLASPYHKSKDNQSLRQFDFVVSNPPFKMDFSDTRDQIAAMPVRFWAGVPKILNMKKDSMAIYTCFIQHVINSLKCTGKGAIVVPSGFLTAKSGVERKILETIINEKIIYGCIGMPSNVFATTGTNVSVLFFDKSRESEKVILIDGSNLGEEYKEGKNKKRRLRETEIDLIVKTFKEKDEIEKFSVLISYDDLKDNNYSLAASQYFHFKPENIDVSKADYNSISKKYYNHLKEIITIKRKEEELLLKYLENNDFKYYESSYTYSDDLKREVPSGWSILKIEDCVEHICTGLNPRDNFTLNNGEIKYVTVKNLTTNGSIDFAGCDTIDKTARELVHKRSDIKIGDILFASIAPLGRCHLIMENPNDWDINESVFSIRPNLGVVTSSFLFMTFTDHTFVKKALSMSTGSIFKGIRISELLNIKILVPPLDIQKEMEAKITTIFKLLRNLESENNLIHDYKDFVFPLLMNGKSK